METCSILPERRLAYFYFDFQTIEKQQTEPLLRSLLTQLLADDPMIPGPIAKLYGELREKYLTPTLKDLVSALSHVLEASSKSTYIILDALDEVPRQSSSDGRKALLKVLTTLAKNDQMKLHLLATSRDEPDIREAIEGVSHQEMHLGATVIDFDIMAYVRSCLADPMDRLNILPEELKTDIVFALGWDARGM